MPVVTFAISALPPFFRNTTLASFSRPSFCARLFRTPVDELRVVVAFVPLRDLLFFLFDFFWTQIALARANGYRLHRHGHNVFHLVRLDVRGTAERRLQHHVVVFDSNFHLKIGDFFLGAGASCLPCVTDLINGPFESPIAISVDFYFGLVAQLHIHNVILVYIDTRFHVAEVGDAHHFRAGELPRGYKTFAQFAVENRDRAVNR